MTVYQYSSEILDGALEEAGELTDGSSDYEGQALKYLNRVYRAIWTGGNEFLPNNNPLWWWMRSTKPGVITQEPTEEVVGQVTNNDTLVTLTAVLVNTHADWLLKVKSHPDVFHIQSHTAGTALITLDSPYTGDNGTGIEIELYKLRYSLEADLLDMTSSMRAFRDGQHEVEMVDHHEMRQKWPLNQVHKGVPRNFARISETEIEFSHAGTAGVTDYTRIEYDYFVKPADLTDSGSEEPIIPLEYRHILVDGIAMLLLNDKDDSRAADKGAIAKEGIRGMWRNHQAQKARGEGGFMQVRPNPSVDYRRGPLRTESGLIIG